MRIALAQVNPTVGDLPGNAALVARFAQRAREAGADLVVFPELVLCGYPPRDLLMQEGFVQACAREAKRVGESSSAGLTLVFGTPLPVQGRGRSTANALVAYRDGAFLDYYDKRLLPTYDVFDEDRYFEPGNRAVVIDVGGVGVGLSICEDLWRGEDAGFARGYADAPDPVADMLAPGRAGAGPPVGIIINPSASPFVMGKGSRQRDILRRHAVARGVHVAAVNQVGGNDELVFDGHGVVVSPSGEVVAAAPGFEEHLLVADIAPGAGEPPVPDPAVGTATEELLWRALVLGTRDYVRKTGFSSAVMGLSGGIDSAVTAVIAAAALTPGKVLGVSLPSRYSSRGSLDDAAELARRLGVAYQVIPIEPAFATLLGSLQPALGDGAPGLAEENLQSRIRGTILMALSNKLGHMLFTTGNKSELAVGYCTLYGDMKGGLAVLQDVTKHWVYRLAGWINANAGRLGIARLTTPPIPEASITKPPSAELRPGQTDQDTLPPYDVVDRVIERYIEGRQAAATIVRDTGIAAEGVARIIRLVDLSEYKRRQAPVGIKVTGVAFGSGRRMPIARR